MVALLDRGTIAIPEASIGPVSSMVEVDAAVAALRARAPAWSTLDLQRRINLLTDTMAATDAVAAQWVELECRRKGIDPSRDVAGEEWFLGPAFVLRNLRLVRRTLEAIARDGRPELPGRCSTGHDGRTVVPVFPTDTYDRLLWLGYRGDVWLPPDVGPDDLDDQLAAFYRGRAPTAGQVCLVLGAGNVSSIAPNDALAKLFIDGQVVLLKLNPVTAHLVEVYEAALRPLVTDGWLRIVIGGTDLGTYLAHHPGIDTIHLTGSDKTFDAVVFGPGDEGRVNKAAGRQLIDKPVTAELGCVTPIVVVPGPWSTRELGYQGRQIASSMLFNAGFNCISTRLLVTASRWAQRSALLDEVRRVLRTYPSRASYYPGACERFDEVIEAHPEAERYGPEVEDLVPWTLIPGVRPADDEPLLRVDAFAPVMAELRLDAPSAAAFVDRAVELCNDQVWGTLGVTLLVHPRSTRDPAVAAAVERAIRELRYGTVGVNAWCAFGYSAVSVPWGAFPGHTADDIQSGIGFVHNTYLLDRPEKTVVRGPFTTWPQPSWFVTFGRRREVLSQDARLEADPSARRLPGLFWSAARG